jgi:hypothetical protein
VPAVPRRGARHRPGRARGGRSWTMAPAAQHLRQAAGAAPQAEAPAGRIWRGRRRNGQTKPDITIPGAGRARRAGRRWRGAPRGGDRGRRRAFRRPFPRGDPWRPAYPPRRSRSKPGCGPSPRRSRRGPGGGPSSWSPALPWCPADARWPPRCAPRAWARAGLRGPPPGAERRAPERPRGRPTIGGRRGGGVPGPARRGAATAEGPRGRERPYPGPPPGRGRSASPAASSTSRVRATRAPQTRSNSATSARSSAEARAASARAASANS